MSISSIRVKPAVFDLFLGGCIAGYLGLVYYAIQVRSTIDDKTHHTRYMWLFHEPEKLVLEAIVFYLQNFGNVYARLKAVLKNKLQWDTVGHFAEVLVDNVHEFILLTIWSEMFFLE